MEDFRVSNDSIPTNYSAGKPAQKQAPKDSVPTTEDIRKAIKALLAVSTVGGASATVATAGISATAGVAAGVAATAGTAAVKVAAEKQETDKVPEQKSEAFSESHAEVHKQLLQNQKKLEPEVVEDLRKKPSLQDD